MDLNEAGRRIVVRHWSVIVFCICMGVGLTALMHIRDTVTYTASARLVLDTQDPESRAESVAIADTAKAIATSPSQVSDALRNADVPERDPLEVAERHVSVRALGSSGVLQLSVTDPSPHVAAAVANALAAQLIQTRSNVTKGEVQRVLTELDARIAALNRRIGTVDAQVEDLNVQAAGAVGPERLNALRAKRNEAERLRDFLAQQRSVLEGQSIGLLSTEALRPKPLIISRATPPPRADSSRQGPDIALGALLGLVLGIGIAGLLEVIRPTLVGGDMLARTFETPLLGTLRSDPHDKKDAENVNAIGARLRLAARVAGVRDVMLFAVGPPADLARLAERLQAVPGEIELLSVQTEGEVAQLLEAQSGARARWVADSFSTDRPRTEERASSAQGLRIGTVELNNSSVRNGVAAGVVLVSPTSLKNADVLATSHLLRGTPWPVVGLIAYTPSASSKGRRAMGAPPVVVERHGP